MTEFAMDPEFLRTLILKVRAFLASDSSVDPDSGGFEKEDRVPPGESAQFGDLTRAELLEEINGLDNDQKAELVALMWLGRGDGDTEDWDELLDLARERKETRTSKYLLGHPDVADAWVEGLDKMGLATSVLEEGSF